MRTGPALRRYAPVILWLAIASAACSGDDESDGSNGNELGNAGAAGKDSAKAGSNAANAGSNAANAGSGDNAGSSASAGTGAPGADASKLYGGFNVKLKAAMPATPLGMATDAATNVLGKIKDGEEPAIAAWSETDADGDCKLFEPRVVFCDPDCGGSAACVEDDRCEPFPKAVTVGDVEVTGLGAPFTMKAISGNYQPDSNHTLAYPPCAEGDVVKVAAEGGDFDAFTLETRCIDVLEFEGPLSIEEGEPLALSWSPAGSAGVSRIQVKLDISHHGGSKGKIECDVVDTGSLEIAARLTDKLVALGVAGFPTVSLTRIATGGPTGAQPEHVTLSVSQTAEQLVEIPGLTSCTGDEHCPEGQSCRADLTCG